MSKSCLIDEDEKLLWELVNTFLEGHHQYRPDLHYPDSHSDMKGGMLAVLRMFDIKRRPIAVPNKIKCDACEGLKKFINVKEFYPNGEPASIETTKCKICGGRGYLERH